MRREEVVVLGGGVTGLTTALQLARAGYAVQLWADKRGMAAPNWIWEFPPYNVAGVASSGPPRFCNPDPQVVQQAEERAMRWARESYPEFVRLASEAPAADVHLVPVFNMVKHRKLPLNPGADFLIEYQHGPPALEAAKAHTALEYNDAECYMAPGCHGPTYLIYLTNQFKELGGVVCPVRVDSIASCIEKMPGRVLVNCLGLSAREMVPDNDVYPCKGQVLHVPAPWARACIFSDEPDAYQIALPGHELELGGTSEDFIDTRQPDHSELDRILTENAVVTPSLLGTTGADAWVGLRPKRYGGIRLEMQRVDASCGERVVIHNYGHGGAGMCVSYGCATEVLSSSTTPLRTV